MVQVTLRYDTQFLSDGEAAQIQGQLESALASLYGSSTAFRLQQCKLEFYNLQTPIRTLIDIQGVPDDEDPAVCDAPVYAAITAVVGKGRIQEFIVITVTHSQVAESMRGLSKA